MDTATEAEEGVGVSLLMVTSDPVGMIWAGALFQRPISNSIAATRFI